MRDKRQTKTVNINSALHQELKVQAAKEQKTVQQLVEEVLQASLGIQAD